MEETAKKTVLRMIPYGLYVLGGCHDGKMSMATVNWVTQTSFAPPLFVMGVKGESHSHECLESSRKFALSMLKSGRKNAAHAFFKPAEPEGETCTDSHSPRCQRLPGVERCRGIRGWGYPRDHEAGRPLHIRRGGDRGGAAR